MPQFDIANFAPQLVWLAIFFAVLYFGIVRPTLPKIDRVVTQRESAVGADLSAAEQAKSQADTTRAAYEQEIATARAQAQAQVAEAKAATARQIEAKLKSLGQELDAKTAAAQAQVDEARRAALADMSRVAEESASAIVERLIGRAPAEAEVRTAVAAAQGA